ncbi:MAG: alpha/beta fold hydrolase, partial [Proteobacteria bacterium]|nr:alpha/beta fold hydrolase [Pseudomonadota bacterium]
MIDVLRTPPERLAGLPDWPYAPSCFKRRDGLAVQYLDAGPRHAPRTWLCLHGQPTWSYLYRRMIPAFLAAGDRVIAPDFLGFGGSDKPREEAVYTFDFHRETMLELIETLDLGNIVLTVQDWGGLIGLTLPMADPRRYRSLLVMNTALGTGDEPLSEGFLAWRAFSNSRPDMDIAQLMKRACPHLTDAEAAAYAAPYPD